MHSHSSHSKGLVAGTALLAATGLVAGLILGTAAAAEGDGQSLGFSSDPTVGTLPMQTGGVPDLPGVDQVVYLWGPVDLLRAALADQVFDVTYRPGAAVSGVWALPNDFAWIEFHGSFALHWSDPSVLAGIELGVGSGFEGGGMICIVESLAGTTSAAPLQAGHSLPVSPERLHDVGLLERPVLLHGLHATGVRTEVTFEAPAGGFSVRQRL